MHQEGRNSVRATEKDSFYKVIKPKSQCDLGLIVV